MGMLIEIGINLLWNSHNCFDSLGISARVSGLFVEKSLRLNMYVAISSIQRTRRRVLLEVSSSTSNREMRMYFSYKRIRSHAFSGNNKKQKHVSKIPGKFTKS